MKHVLLLLLVLATMQAAAQVKVEQKPSVLAVPKDSLSASFATKNDTATQSIMLKQQLNRLPVSNQIKLRPVDYKFLPSSSFYPNMPEDQAQQRMRRRNMAEYGYGSSLVEAGVSILQGIFK